MATKPLEISLDANLRRFVEAQPEGAGKYFARLVHEDRSRRLAELDSLLVAAAETPEIEITDEELDSGVSIPDILRRKRSALTNVS